MLTKLSLGLAVTDPSDELSSLTIAMQWATRIMAISLEMVVPGLLGYWLDQKLGTVAVFTLLGFGLGCSWAMWHLIRMTSMPNGTEARPNEEKETKQPLSPKERGTHK